MPREDELMKEEEVLDEIVDKPMGDNTIREILPKCPIVLYNELKKYPHINQLLPKVGSYAIILYQDSPHSGHWTAVLRPTDNQIEYFDSYGKCPDEPLSWSSPEKQNQLGIHAPYLSNLLKASGKKLVWNKKKFQKDNDPEISTCGRHCCFRIQMMKNRGYNIHQYQKMLEAVKNKTGKVDQ